MKRKIAHIHCICLAKARIWGKICRNPSHTHLLSYGHSSMEMANTADRDGTMNAPCTLAESTVPTDRLAGRRPAWPRRPRRTESTALGDTFSVQPNFIRVPNGKTGAYFLHLTAEYRHSTRWTVAVEDFPNQWLWLGCKNCAKITIFKGISSARKKIRADLPLQPCWSTACHLSVSKSWDPTKSRFAKYRQISGIMQRNLYFGPKMCPKCEQS